MIKNHLSTMITKKTAILIAQRKKILKNHRRVEECRKESRLCSSIHRYHQKWISGSSTIHSHSRINSNKNNIGGHPQNMDNTDFQNSMQSIEYNKENHSTLNQVYDILTEFQNERHKIYYMKSQCT